MMTDITPKQKEQKRLTLYMLISAISLSVLSSVIITPLYVYSTYHPTLYATILPPSLDVIIDLIDILTYSVCFAIIIYSIIKYSFKASIPRVVIYAAAVLFKYAANYVISSLMDGVFTTGDIVFVVIYYLIDILILALVVVISFVKMKRFYERQEIEIKANNTLGQENLPLNKVLFAPKKLFSLSNPLSSSAAVIAALLSLSKIATRVIYDISYGAPTSFTDTLWMIVAYLSDLIIAVIFYLVAMLIFLHLNEKFEKDIA